MNLSSTGLGKANAAIAKRLFPDFDARDTGANQIDDLMNAARAEGYREGAVAGHSAARDEALGDDRGTVVVERGRWRQRLVDEAIEEDEFVARMVVRP